jgi:SET domain-containing protein
MRATWSVRLSSLRQKSKKVILPENFCKSVQFTNNLIITTQVPIVQTMRENIPNFNVIIRTINNPKHSAYLQKGLFASTYLKKNFMIGKYVGELISHSPRDQSYLYYVGHIHGNVYYIDAKDYGNEMRYINDFRGIAERANVMFKRQITNNKDQFKVDVSVISLRDIECDEELLIDYGDSFWRD